MLPRYNNNVATLRKQRCHATQTILPRYNNVEKRTEDELEDKLEDRLVSVSAMLVDTLSKKYRSSFYS